MFRTLRFYHSFFKFLSTPSSRRATGAARHHATVPTYFYPRPPRGGRHNIQFSTLISALFLSTPSARRATDYRDARRNSIPDFYPRPPRGGRPQRQGAADRSLYISIHALREEGDSVLIRRSAHLLLFLSTPSARRATAQCCKSRVVVGISIHALREEGDLCVGKGGKEAGEFLSTPSARRATAKTERKHPAFVSLYTSLHKLQRDACKTNRKITPLLAQTAGIPVRSVPENHVCCRFALAGHQKISTLSWANSGCSPTCSTLVW